MVFFSFGASETQSSKLRHPVIVVGSIRWYLAHDVVKFQRIYNHLHRLQPMYPQPLLTWNLIIALYHLPCKSPSSSVSLNVHSGLDQPVLQTRPHTLPSMPDCGHVPTDSPRTARHVRHLQVPDLTRRVSHRHPKRILAQVYYDL